MVYILLGEGFEEAEALVPCDFLRRAGVDVKLVALEELTVTGGHGMQIVADCLLSEVDAEAMRMLVLPGGLGGVASIRMNLFALALIQQAYDRGAYLAAICAAPTILATMGFLDRRRATCYPGMEDEMGSAIAVSNQRVVQDGRIITAQAAGSAARFAFKLVEVLCGSEEAGRVAGEVYF